MEIDMSAFVVNNMTIHRCLYGLVYAKLARGYSPSLGQKLLDLNVRAVNARYNEKDVAPKFEDMGEMDVSKMSAVKALHCLRYQCSEGDVPKDPLFKKISRAIEILSEDIVCNLPEWSKVPWDS
jgi:hypothetical protein